MILLTRKPIQIKFTLHILLVRISQSINLLFSFLIPHFSFLISHFSFLISHFTFLISHFSFFILQSRESPYASRRGRTRANTVFFKLPYNPGYKSSCQASFKKREPIQAKKRGFRLFLSVFNFRLIFSLFSLYLISACGSFGFALLVFDACDCGLLEADFISVCACFDCNNVFLDVSYSADDTADGSNFVADLKAYRLSAFPASSGVLS